MFFSRRRSVRGLFLSWLVYWVLLFAVKLGPALAAIWHTTRGPDGDNNSISVNFSNFVLNLLVAEQGKTIWTGSAHLGAIALWVAGVPLLLWLMWMTARPGERAAAGDVGQPV